MGADWSNNKMRKISNPFLKHVLGSGCTSVKNQSHENMSEIMYSPLWYNNQISKEVLFYESGKKGKDVVDILNKDWRSF